LQHDGTDNFIPHTINIVAEKASHPIVVGLADFDLLTEQYWVLSDTYNDVLATTTLAARPDDPWLKPVTVPAIWTRNWGRGRIFVCTPGHLLEVLDDPNVRTIVERGMLWASR
jgi:type 1 glutamine amidotransferase